MENSAKNPSYWKTPIRLDKKIEGLELQAHELACSVEAVRQQTLAQSNARIEALEQKARDLAWFVETTRQQTLLQSDKKTEALEQKARDLANFVETLRNQTRLQSETEIEALGQKARDLALFVETVRTETQLKSESEIEAMGQQARNLAISVEAVRQETLLHSDTEIAALGQQARDLAVSVETAREETLLQSDTEIAMLGRRARELAVSVEAVREETFLQADSEIKGLKQQARNLAVSVEKSRIATYMKSDKVMAETVAGHSAERLQVNREHEIELDEKSTANEQLRNAHNQLQIQNRHLLELTRLAHDFVDQVSHDFRTPLCVIKESASILNEGIAGPINDEQKVYLAMLMDKASHLATMVDDMLDMSRLDAGVLPMHRRYVPVASIFDRLRRTFKHKAMANQIVLEFELEASLPTVYCDPEKVGRAITNLVTNAIKFCEEGSIVRIWARMDEEPGRVRIGVTDNGPGMAPENLKRLFERFEQIKGISATTEGFGLGLNIVRNLVRLNLSEVNVESELGKGSTFSFALPCGEPAAIIRSYLARLELPPAGPEAICLLCADATAASLDTDVELLLEQLLRSNDLLFRSRDNAWLIMATCDEYGAEQLIERVNRAREAANRNRPQGGIAEIHWRNLAVWQASADSPGFCRAVASACRTLEEAHA